MKVDNQLVDMGDDIKNAQSVKDIVIRKLYREGLIDIKTCNEYLQNEQIFVFKTSWWRNWKNIFTDKQKDGYYYQLLNIDIKEKNNNSADENTNEENNGK